MLNQGLKIWGVTEGTDGIGCRGCFIQDGRTGLGRMIMLRTINSSGGGNGLGNILEAALRGVARMAFLAGVFRRF